MNESLKLNSKNNSLHQLHLSPVKRKTVRNKTSAITGKNKSILKETLLRNLKTKPEFKITKKISNIRTKLLIETDKDVNQNQKMLINRANKLGRFKHPLLINNKLPEELFTPPIYYVEFENAEINETTDYYLHQKKSSISGIDNTNNKNRASLANTKIPNTNTGNSASGSKANSNKSLNNLSEASEEDSTKFVLTEGKHKRRIKQKMKYITPFLDLNRSALKPKMPSFFYLRKLCDVVGKYKKKNTETFINFEAYRNKTVDSKSFNTVNIRNNVRASSFSPQKRYGSIGQNEGPNIRSSKDNVVVLKIDSPFKSAAKPKQKLSSMSLRNSDKFKETNLDSIVDDKNEDILDSEEDK